MIKNIIIGFMLFFITGYCFTQEIVTAEDYFNRVSEIYAEIIDYKAEITIDHGANVMKGILLYSNQNMMKIEFTNPDGQIILVDSEKLSVYVPQHSVIFQQDFKPGTELEGPSIGTGRGLVYLANNYSITYFISPDPVPIDEESEELVVKLRLISQTRSEGFRQLVISVDEDGFIRHIKAWTIVGEQIVFKFDNIVINQGIPATRFTFDPPSITNVYSNFLYGSEE